MSGFISEFFGYRADDKSEQARAAAERKLCPFTNCTCTKILSRAKVPSGVCAIRQKMPGSPSVICCPFRIYADDYAILHEIAHRAFQSKLNLYSGRDAVGKAIQEKGAIAVFGKGWGGELCLPKRKGIGNYFVDWVLARLDEHGELAEFTAVEVQTIDTTGNYQTARKALIDCRKIVADTVGLNWENVNKRIISQLIYKGQVLQREDLCKKGLFFVSPKPVHDRVLERLGGKEKLPSFPDQNASIHFIAYDYNAVGPEVRKDGEILSLGTIEEYSTTVFKVQEAFSAVTLPDEHVFRDAIMRSLFSAFPVPLRK